MVFTFKRMTLPLFQYFHQHLFHIIKDLRLSLRALHKIKKADKMRNRI